MIALNDNVKICRKDDLDIKRRAALATNISVIQAYARGEVIECRNKLLNEDWYIPQCPRFDDKRWEYRIKPALLEKTFWANFYSGCEYPMLYKSKYMANQYGDGVFLSDGNRNFRMACVPITVRYYEGEGLDP